MEANIQSIDVTIVGGGMAGLTAAVYLARAGKSVTLFEKAAELGGRASTQNAGGYLHNRGIHALFTGGVADAVLRELGVAYTAGAPRRTAASVLHEGKLHLGPSDAATLLKTNALSLGDKLEMMRLFALIGKLDARSLGHTSVQAWLDTHIHRPRVRALFAALAKTFVYRSNLDLVSAEVFILKTQIAAKHPLKSA